MLIRYKHFIESGKLRIIMSGKFFLLVLFIIINNLSFVKLKLPATIISNMTCVNISFASISSRNDDRFSQLKLFASPQFISNYSNSCGKFEM